MDIPTDLASLAESQSGLLFPRRTLLFGAGALALGGWSAAQANPIGDLLLPTPPAFPCFRDRREVIAEARGISDRLESHIKAWMDGNAPARLPAKLIPKGVDLNDFTSMTLVKPEEIKPEQQWGIREARLIDFKGLLGQYPDPHCTYLLIPVVFAPFGTKVTIEGQFPHCRFFDIQATPPFHPEAYHFAGWAGVGEVPIVDVDIEPLPGHTNPFRPGQRRDAAERSYRVTLDLAIGNPAELDPAFRPPFYRAQGNRRVAGGILYQGPWGMVKKGVAHGRGPWTVGNVWIRYYAPDNARGPLAGVPLPKVTYELPDGRRFYVQSDFSNFARRMNRTEPARQTAPEEPPGVWGPTKGWDKMWGIFRAIFGGIASNTRLADKDWARRLDKGVCGRGEDMPPPGNYEPSATTCTYINYLLRGMALGKGMVCVLTGRLPTTPRTRNGESLVERAQARYWSLTGYDMSLVAKDGYAGAAVHSIMDDEIVVDSQQRYVMVFSRAEDRPANAAPAAGVTWVNWGPTSKQSWTLRWLSVAPDWVFSKTPHEKNLGWETDWASVRYDPSLIARNSHGGWLGEFLPQVHYLSKEDFERLGDRVTPAKVPVWR